MNFMQRRARTFRVDRKSHVYRMFAPWSGCRCPVQDLVCLIVIYGIIAVRLAVGSCGVLNPCFPWNCFHSAAERVAVFR